MLNGRLHTFTDKVREKVRKRAEGLIGRPFSPTRETCQKRACARRPAVCWVPPSLKSYDMDECPGLSLCHYHPFLLLRFCLFHVSLCSPAVLTLSAGSLPDVLWNSRLPGDDRARVA